MARRLRNSWIFPNPAFQDEHGKSQSMMGIGYISLDAYPSSLQHIYHLVNPVGHRIWISFPRTKSYTYWIAFLDTHSLRFSGKRSWSIHDGAGLQGILFSKLPGEKRISFRGKLFCWPFWVRHAPIIKEKSMNGLADHHYQVKAVVEN